MGKHRSGKNNGGEMAPFALKYTIKRFSLSIALKRDALFSLRESGSRVTLQLIDFVPLLAL